MERASANMLLAGLHIGVENIQSLISGEEISHLLDNIHNIYHLERSQVKDCPAPQNSSFSFNCIRIAVSASHSLL